MQTLSRPLAAALLAGGVLLSGLASAGPENSFGTATHEVVKATDSKYDYPYSAIGRVNTGCTGTLVGKRLVLTAAHCVVDSDSGNVLPQLKTFELNVVDGKAAQRFDIRRAWIGTYSPVAKRLKDWALLEIKGKVDADVKPLKLAAVDFNAQALPYAIDLAGYNVDKANGGSLSVATDCSIRELTKKKDGETNTQVGLLLHDCSSASGISGGPLFKYDGETAKIEAISVSERRKGALSMHVDEYAAEYANIGIPVTDVATTLNQLAKSVDSGTSVPTLPNVFLVNVDDSAATTSSSDNSSGVSTGSTSVQGSLRAGGNSTCSLSDAGKLTCWGGDITVPSASFKEVALGDSYACGVTTAGALNCWAWGKKVAPETPNIHGAHLLTLGADHACALDDKNTIACWGSNVFDQLNAPQISSVVELAAGARHTCARTDKQVLCWGDGAANQTSAPDLRAPKQIATGGLSSCAIEDEKVKCWGFRPVADPRVLPTLKNPKQLAVGLRHACALDDSGVQCWGSGDVGQLQVPTLDNPTEITAGDYHTCAKDRNGVKCWGQSAQGQTSIPK